MSEWIAEEFVAKHSDAAQQFIAMGRGYLCETLWASVARALTSGTFDEDEFAFWAAVLSARPPADGGYRLTYVAMAANLPRDSRAFAVLFRRLLEPKVELTSGVDLGAGSSVRAGVTVLAEQSSLAQFIEEKVFPDIDSLAPDLYPVAIDLLVQYTWMYRSFDGASSSFDSVSFRRAAIEDHAQNLDHEPQSLVVDVAREAALARARRLGAALVAADLQASPAKIVNRIATIVVSEA